AVVIEELKLKVPLPAIRSSIVAGARRTRVERDVVYEQYTKNYAVAGLYENLKFAMRYEPVDLGVLHVAFEKIEAKTVETWVRSESTGIYARKIWYLYELLTGQTLDLPDVAPTGYVNLLNPKLQLVAEATQIRRQRVNDNLLGNRDYCPLVRRTETLDRLMAEKLGEEAKKTVEQTDPVIMARAVNYLYTRETKSSFAIEGETAGKTRAERFVAALERAADFAPTEKESFVRLQNQIVDARFAASDWRTIQNYVGQTMRDYSEQVHFVCPKPGDVDDLINGWMRFVEKLQSSGIDSISAAAALSFGFVFIHPFEDGNGRIHRFLIHHELAHSGFAPPGLILPVSAVMLRERAEYDRVLESFSKKILPFVEYELDARGEMMVENDTAHLYRYWDATEFAEFLYHCVGETIRRDLREELGFLEVFDRALQTVMEIVDMPNRRASLLVRMILQNRGELSKNKREKEFPELTSAEITQIENAIKEISN
ncbi:MAG: Fic family protein, partial [Acidobacteriota bacterium]|nr:Fic family protein [Acidobacteriota bacterium]